MSRDSRKKEGKKPVTGTNEPQLFSNFVVFKAEKGKVNIDVFFQDETLWLTQKKMAELFEKGRSTITEHLKNIFDEGELVENSVCRDFRHTAEDGKAYTSKFYNLRAITAVGFRVNSHRAIDWGVYRVSQARRNAGRQRCQ